MNGLTGRRRLEAGRTGGGDWRTGPWQDSERIGTGERSIEAAIKVFVDLRKRTGFVTSSCLRFCPRWPRQFRISLYPPRLVATVAAYHGLGHHNTSAHSGTYRQQMDYSLPNSVGAARTQPLTQKFSCRRISTRDCLTGQPVRKCNGPASPWSRRLHDHVRSPSQVSLMLVQWGEANVGWLPRWDGCRGSVSN